MSESEIEKWNDAPSDVRARLVERLKSKYGFIDAVKELMEFRKVPFRDTPNLTHDETVALAAAKTSINRLQKAIDHTPCPFCGKPLRHPAAQQCLECRTDWHGKTPPDKRW